MNHFGFEFKEWHKHLLVGGASLFFTLIAATAGKRFIEDHPVISILIVLAMVPLFLPFNKILLGRLRSMRFLGKYLAVIMLGIFLGLLMLSMTSYFIIAFLLILHAISSIFLRILKRAHVGVEIVLLTTVISGVSYGAKFGAAIGAVAMLMDYVFSGRISIFSIVTIPTYALIGALSASFATSNLLVLGLGMCLFYNLFSWIFIMGFMGGDLEKCIRFGVTNLGWNALVFSTLAPGLLMFMG